MYHRGAIESYPLQVYASALLFSPTKSLIRRLFQHEEPKGITIKPSMSDEWSACLQTLEGHSGEVNSVAFSHDSARLASASGDHTAKIWDASSGACLQTLEGHSGYVSSVAFSPDSTRLASASDDRTVKIWDASSGACLQTLEGHSDWVRSVAFSPDSTRLASASGDHTVKIWDASSGACLQTLNTRKTLYDLSFDATSSCLYTEIGTIVVQNSQASISDVVEPKRPLYLGIGVSPDSIWIQHAGKNMLWMPSEYRSSCSAVSGNTVGIGVGSGRVWSCSIDLEHE
jgi:WD40 repeat protein